jgi:hypothetical protein
VNGRSTWQKPWEADVCWEESQSSVRLSPQRGQGERNYFEGQQGCHSAADSVLSTSPAPQKKERQGIGLMLVNPNDSGGRGQEDCRFFFFDILGLNSGSTLWATPPATPYTHLFFFFFWRVSSSWPGQTEILFLKCPTHKRARSSSRAPTSQV